MQERYKTDSEKIQRHGERKLRIGTTRKPYRIRSLGPLSR